MPPGIPRSVLVAVLGATALICLVLALLTLRRRRQDERLRQLKASGGLGDAAPATQPALLNDFALNTLPKIGAPLLPDEDAGLSELQSRLRKAGYYHPNSAGVYLGVRMLLLALAIVPGLAVGLTRLLPPAGALLFAGIVAGVGVVAPGLWLDGRTRERRDLFRRALPDALDVMVICVEGGLSLAEAIRRVSSELRTAHPLLASEMAIVQREMLLGLSAGEAMRRFASRCDLEEVRSLASVLTQSERFGASTTKALRIQADVIRLKRHQRAEERAQRAAVFILFPTLLCIFPAVFLVFLGPAIFRILEMFSQVK